MTDRYQDAEALRRALDDPIRNTARQEGIPHDRLRKQIAFQRLIARFAAVSTDSWALKGGTALNWRIGEQVRATRDIDANWFGESSEFTIFLDSALDTDLADSFLFEIGAPSPLRGEVAGGHRYAVTTLLAGREFTAFHLDVNHVAGDDRPVDLVEVNVAILEFIGKSRLQVPMISIAQQLAEKLHAVGRYYESEHSSRPKDVYDTALLIQTYPTPGMRAMREAVEATFTLRDDQIPRQAPKLPESWRADIKAYLDDFPIDGIHTFQDIAETWARFWTPLLDRSTVATRWDPPTSKWH